MCVRFVSDTGCLNPLSYCLQAYWDAHSDIIESGIAWSGRLEKFFVAYHRDQLARIVDTDAVDKFCNARSLEEQREAFKQLLANGIEEMTKWVVDRTGRIK